MRRILMAVAMALYATSALANDCVFSVAANAGIPGYNDETLGSQSAAACMAACSSRDWCKSADYERAVNAGAKLRQCAGAIVHHLAGSGRSKSAPLCGM